MRYNGIKLKEFTSDKPVVFDPPKRMVVWDDHFGPREEEVVAFLGDVRSEPVVAVNGDWEHCAELPEEPKARRATNRELAKWLAQGNGEGSMEGCSRRDVTFVYYRGGEDKPVNDKTFVRKWDDTEWREPTVDYMFGEDAE